MSIDLQSYSFGIASAGIHQRLEGHASTILPKDSNRTMRTYVDTYIKVFYFPPEDAIVWIEENHENYLEAHMTALIVGAAMSSSEEDRTTIRLGELVAKVSSLYHDDNEKPLQ